jgi:hypothetical protein
MESTTFDLGPNEAALIFKQDMSIEMVLPKLEDDEEVNFDDNQNIFVAMAIGSLTDNPNFRQLVGGKLNEILGMAGGCSGSGCSGCNSKPKDHDCDGTGPKDGSCCGEKDEESDDE